MFDALIKVGGSLYHMPELRSCAAQWSRLAAQHRLLLMPGGGPFADQVRAADAKLGLSSSATHWMALLAMDQYAYLLADLMPGAALVRDLRGAAACCAEGRPAVLAPSALVLQTDPLVHSWDVTSDSLSAWLAGYAEIDLLVLLKSVAGVVQIDTKTGESIVVREVARSTLAQHHIVDPYFAQALPAQVTCWMVDGRYSERLAELLRSGHTLGTLVI